MSYKTVIGSTMVTAGIALAIIGLSINHKRQIAASAADAVAAKGSKSPRAEGSSARPALQTDRKAQVVSGGHCNLERIDGAIYDAETHRPSLRNFELSGWVVDPSTKSVPANIRIRFERIGSRDIWTLPLLTTIDRPDVVASQGGVQAYLHSGFVVNIDSSGLPVGEYHLFIQYQSAGRIYVCDNGRLLKVGK